MAVQTPCLLTPIEKCTVTVRKEIYYVGPVKMDAAIAPIPIGPVYTAVTDAQGRYTIDSIPVTVNGEWIVVTARKAGFVAQAIDSTLWNTMTTRVNFSLVKSNVSAKKPVSTHQNIARNTGAVKVYNIRGALVKTVVSRVAGTGIQHEIRAPGIYCVKQQGVTAGLTRTMKVR